MTERHDGSVESSTTNPTTNQAAGDGPAEGSDALTALQSIWSAGRQSGTDLDEARPKAKVCRNMKNIGFGGIAGEDDNGSTAVPVGEDMRSAWRDLLQREGKFHPGGTATMDAAERN